MHGTAHPSRRAPALSVNVMYTSAIQRRPLAPRFCPDYNGFRKGGPVMVIRKYTLRDLDAMNRIWNEVVEDGIAFPQEVYLDSGAGAAFFSSQTYTGVADVGGEVVGLYILHPNNIGRLGEIANASYAVLRSRRGEHIGEALVKDSLVKAKEFGFRVMQFNAVVESNTHARHLYERLGFVQLGTIPGCFRMKDGNYENICPYFHLL